MDIQSAVNDLEEQIREAANLDASGELTVGKIFHYGFYRLREGEHSNKIVIYCPAANVDGQTALIFANSMTWIHKDRLKDVKCERTYPTFNEPRHPTDKVQWYSDNGSGPHWDRW